MAQNLTFNLDVSTGSAVSSINQFFAAFDQGAAKAKSTLNTAFNQKLETEVEINLKDGALVAKQIQKASQESKRLEIAAKAINGQFGKTPAALKKQVTILKQLQSNTQKFQKNTSKLTDDWRLVTLRIKQASDNLKLMTQGSPLERLKTGLSGIIGKFTLVQTLSNLATAAIQGFAATGQEFLNMAGRMETLQLQLEAFTGGSDEAAAAFEEFARIAANSPFSLEQVAEAAKIMMAFGVDTGVAVKATEQLGVVAAATGGDINLLARNLGQIAAQGQAYTRDLTQFAIQGIPIWDEMSRVTGANVAELKAMASEGKISFDIVSAALNNLTADGTKFAEVAVRMQETFQGRMAKIASSINQLALAFVNTFNKMDKALGNVVSGSMKAFADGISFLAKNMDKVASAVAALTAATAAYFALSKWFLIAKGVGLVFGFIKKLLTTQMALNAAKAFFVSLSVGGLIKVAAAAGSAAIAYKVVGDAIDNAGEGTEDLTGKTDDLKNATGDLTEKELEYLEAIKNTHKEQIAAYDQGLKARDDLKAKMDLEVERLKAIRDETKGRYNDEISDIKAVISKDKERMDALKDAHDIAMDQTRERHSAALDALDAEIGFLREKTGAEQKLYDFQKKELKDKIKSGDLDKEGKLQAEARLSRMIRQEQIQKLMAQKAETRIKQEREIKGLADEQEAAQTALEAKMTTQEKQIERIKEKRDEELKKINEAVVSTGKVNQANIDTNRTVDEQIDLVNTLAGKYATASDNAETLAGNLRDAAQAQRDINTANANYQAPAGSRSNLSGIRFAGGPVSGGSSYQVNELGKEAFLSASGALSMIKAPAFGTWTAPGSGTVIPAHLTKQLNVPTGGVQLNRGAASKAAGAGGSSDIGRMISALAGSMGGDTVSNNVTIQTENPRQTASDVMVQLAKLKRLRYN